MRTTKSLPADAASMWDDALLPRRCSDGLDANLTIML
jgi:hypothetical protein